MGEAVINLISTEFSERAEAVAFANTSGGLDDLARVDVIIDFSLPDGTAALAKWLQSLHQNVPALVSGTTGLSANILGQLEALGETTKVLHSSNFSAGIAALSSILEFAAPMLTELGYTAVLTESHHAHKLDAPSGTAKILLKVLQPESPDSVQVHSVRAGEVIGKHTVTFYSALDEICIGHEAKDRDLFARGAVDAALWLVQQPEKGRSYTMQSYFRKRYLD